MPSPQQAAEESVQGAVRYAYENSGLWQAVEEATLDQSGPNPTTGALAADEASVLAIAVYELAGLLCRDAGLPTSEAWPTAERVQAAFYNELT